jgi:hypothetical protein
MQVVAVAVQQPIAVIRVLPVPAVLAAVQQVVPLLQVQVMLALQTQAAVAVEWVVRLLQRTAVVTVARELLLFVTPVHNEVRVERLRRLAAIHTTHLHRLVRLRHKENLNGTFCKSC